ncbi:retrovirus-related pol polyprotein from transposon TNT 1-94 [Tanacetum coccineum]
MIMHRMHRFSREFINLFVHGINEIGESSSTNHCNPDVHSFQPQSMITMEKRSSIGTSSWKSNLLFKQDDQLATDTENVYVRDSLGRGLLILKNHLLQLLAWKRDGIFLPRAHKSFQVSSMDVKRNFLMAPLKKEVYVASRKVRWISSSDKRYLLRKALYGLKQAPSSLVINFVKLDVKETVTCTAMTSAEAQSTWELSASCAIMWMRTQLKIIGFNYNKIPLHKVVRLGINPMINQYPEDYTQDISKVEIAVLRTFRVILFSIHNDEWKSFQCHHQTALRKAQDEEDKRLPTNYDLKAFQIKQKYGGVGQ